MKGPKEIFKKVQKKVQIGQNHHFIGVVDTIFVKFCYLFFWGGEGVRALVVLTDSFAWWFVRLWVLIMMPPLIWTLFFNFQYFIALIENKPKLEVCPHFLLRLG